MLKKNTNLVCDQWLELNDLIAEFQTIVKLLLKFEEKKSSPISNGSLHHSRKSIANSNPQSIRVWLRHRGGFVYEVISHLEDFNNYVTTSWLHEDGIWHEREIYKDQVDHPVHSILCMTDLYLNHCREIDADQLDDLVCRQMEIFQEVH